MDKTTIVKDLPGLVGQTATVRGWVATTRSSGKIAFAVIRDGTGYVQCVAVKQEVDESTWETVRELTLEMSVVVTGEVREDSRSPGGVELAVRSLATLGGRTPRKLRLRRYHEESVRKLGRRLGRGGGR